MDVSGATAAIRRLGSSSLPWGVFSANLKDLDRRGSVLVASSLTGFVGVRRVVRPGHPRATYTLGDDKAAALAILLPYRPPATLCVVGPKPSLCFFVETQQASSRHRTSDCRKSTLYFDPGSSEGFEIVNDTRTPGPDSNPDLGVSKS